MDIKKKLIDKYGYNIIRRSALNLPNGAEDLVMFMNRKPVNIAIEIGTLKGVTSALMSLHCNKLFTFDLLYGQLEKIKDTADWVDTPIRTEIWKYLGVYNKIWFQPIKCNNSKERHIKMIGDFDFAFIDGDHSYEGVKFDFDLVKHCGRVLFHDYDKAPGKKCPVRDFINTIKEGKIETTKDYAYWTR